jgi:hypothetical protein
MLSNVEIYDAGDKFIDRFTVIINKEVYTMSYNPLSALGVNQYMGDVQDYKDLSSFGTKISINDKSVTDDMRKAITYRLDM